MGGVAKPTVAAADNQGAPDTAGVEAPEVSMAEGVIAKGRTVVDGNKVKGTGDTVTLPATEIAWLTKHGYLVDPDAEELDEANGPTFERR